MSIGGALVAIDPVLLAFGSAARDVFLFSALSVLFFGVAIGMTAYGAKVTSWDTRDKILAEVAKIDNE